MRWREPLYVGEKAEPHTKEYRYRLRALSYMDPKKLDFYVIKTPANERNLMELIPAAQLKQPFYDPEQLTILGVAADKQEAYELSCKIIEECFGRYGKLSGELICGQVCEKRAAKSFLRRKGER